MKDWRSCQRSLEQGSYSVEAALVMPIVLFVIIALCYMAFYQHDKVRIQSVINNAVLEENLCISHNAELETGQISYESLGERSIFYIIQDHKEEAALLKESLQRQMQSGLFIARVEEIQTQVNGGHIQVEVSCKVQFPFQAVVDYFSGETKMKNRVEIIPHNPAEFVRGYTSIEDATEDNKWFSKIKEKLSSLVNIL